MYSPLDQPVASRSVPARRVARLRRIRSAAVLGTAGVLVTAGLVLTPTSAALAETTAPSCTAFANPVHRLVEPGNGSSLLTSSTNEATKAAADGYTDQGTAFLAATSSAEGLVPVHRMYRPSTGDYLATKSATELVSAAERYGYVDQGVSFYAAERKQDCLQQVVRYRKGGRHRLVSGAADRAAVEAAGWKYENVAFYAAAADSTPAPDPDPAPAPEPDPVPAPGSGSTFSFAVEPDTQLEVLSARDPRMVNRASWLAKQKVSFVAHTGDMVNWDTPDHSQMAIAKQAMDVLHDAGIGYTVAIGNHDTEATGVGGSARDPKNTRALQRDTSTINSYFKASDLGAVAGAYEPGKIDNVYATYSAGGYKWMVLSLEFCARPGVVSWAKQVVADHPDHNVLIATHSYLDGNGNIDSSNQGYGDTSGQQLFDQLVSQYPNIKMVFSGHVGSAEKARLDTGKNGNTIYSFLTTMHDPITNPVRMFDVDTATGTIKTRVYAPYTNTTWSQYTQTLTGVTLVR